MKIPDTLLSALVAAACCIWLGGCTAAYHRQQIEDAAESIIAAKQQEALGRTETFRVEPAEDALRRRLLLAQELPTASAASLGIRDLEPIDHWPEKDDLVSSEPAVRPDAESDEGLASTHIVSLTDALTIAARNNREYQAAKEEVYVRALDLEFERDQFRGTLAGLAEGSGLLDRTAAGDPDGVVAGVDGTTSLSFAQRLKNGMSLSARIGYDLARMLQPGKFFSSAFSGDASITIPLLRGSGRHIVAEPLTQAERNAVYAIWIFERFKQELAVDIVDAYLSVLASADQVRNQEANYLGLMESTRRARRLAEAGKLPQVQVDQSVQSELGARSRWIQARLDEERSLDQLKLLLGLPVDARIALDELEMQRLADYTRARLPALFAAGAAPVAASSGPIAAVPPGRAQAGPLELKQSQALPLALERRLDLLVTEGQVADAQRRVVVAADALRAELTLLGTVSAGERRSVRSASLPDARQLDLGRGLYEGLVTLDLPLERTAEAIAYRESYLALQGAVRAVQALEDQIKLQVRTDLRQLELSRSGLEIQAEAVRLAERRVRGAQLELEAGRIEIRDLLDSQEFLVNAQNALTAATVNYRVAELQMLRDLGVLEVDADGLWAEPDLSELVPPVPIPRAR